VSRRARTWCRDVATGGRPVEAVSGVLLELALGKGVWDVAVRHDDGCPAFRHGLRACDCEVVRLEIRRAA
jgi:hypothetical protein